MGPCAICPIIGQIAQGPMILYNYKTIQHVSLVHHESHAFTESAVSTLLLQ